MFNVFLSYRFEDKAIAHHWTQLLETPDGGRVAEPHRVENDYSALGSEAIDAEIRKVMRTCQAALFAIGDDNHNAEWIRREAKLAESMDLGVVAVQLPGTSGGVPPELGSRGVEAVPWKPAAVQAALRKAMRSS